MIVDSLSNAANYFSLHPAFEKTFEYIKTLDFNHLEIGTTELDGTFLKIAVVKATMRSANDAKLETHQKFIDIQLPVTQKETFGWRSRDLLTDSAGEYDAANDIEFFNDEPTTYITLVPNEFAIFSPEDGHAPLIGEGETIKIIVKVAVL